MHLLVIERKDKILLRQRTAESKRLAGFWELPERGQVPAAIVHEAAGGFRHSMVHTTYLVRIYRASIGRAPYGFHWLAKSALDGFPLSTTTKKALARSLG